MAGSLFRPPSSRADSEEPSTMKQQKLQNDENKELYDAINHLVDLEKIQVTGLGLRFQINGKTVSYQDDQFYRQFAQQHHETLGFFFTYGLPFAMIFFISTELNGSIPEKGSEYEESEIESFSEMKIYTAISYFLIFSPLIFFGRYFFKSDDYYTKQTHLVSSVYCLVQYMFSLNPFR